MGVSGATSGTCTASQKCLWMKELVSPKICNDASLAEEWCGRSPIITFRSMLRTYYFCE
jgi:hypothetical protein